MSRENSEQFVIPISYESTEIIETGKWSSRKPETVHLTAPCREACPAGTDIPLIVHLIGKGRSEEALAAILAENPFPGVCGRVCYHPCEAGCNRACYDEPVSIQVLERYVSGSRMRHFPLEPQVVTGPRRIAIVGAGPAGLACAYFLALLGHHVTVFEAGDEPGGVMRHGIPEFRLPRKVLNAEIGRLLTLLIELKTNCRVGRDISFDELESFDALFLSPGAEVNSILSIDGENLPGVWKGGEFLREVNSGKGPRLGAETIVVGGGNTAIDVARSALRLGSSLTVAYRRNRDAMPAIPDEVAEAEEEGVRFAFLLQPVSVRRLESGRLAVTFERMEIRAPDHSGRATAVPIPGDHLVLECDSLISAVGEVLDSSWMPERILRSGMVEPGAETRIFAGGDAVRQPRTIVHAIASAKKAAISMDLMFRGAGQQSLEIVGVGAGGSLSMAEYLKIRAGESGRELRNIVSAEKIATLYFQRSSREKAGKIGMGKRLRTFLEVNLHPDRKRAMRAASRCYSCGRCNGCLNCFYFCPEGVIAVDPDRCTRTVDYAHCKGCATCATACPRSAVAMVEMKD